MLMLQSYTDAGRAKSRRRRQRMDCTVRAFALVTGLVYDDAYDILKSAGRKSGCGFDLFKYLRGKHGFEYLPFPAKKGEKRMDVAKFAHDHPRGAFILRIAKHVTVCRSGVIYDVYPIEPARCVYGAMRVTL